MNNEEKAKELTDNIWNCDNDVVRESIRIASKLSAIQMAEWKDQQFVEFVKKNRGKFVTDRAMDAFLVLLKQENF